LRTYFGAARVYALSSGRAAIALGLRALGIGRGDDVAIPAFTCPAVADAVLSLGAIPHLVDVSPRHFGLEARSLRRVLARGRTRAAVVAPLFGAVPPQEEIESLLGERGVPWLEDVAQAFGARRAGRPVGSPAPLAVISTNFDKPYTTGRGGALVVNDAGLAERVDELVDALPTQTRSEAELILKGLIISDYLFEAESYQPFVSVDLGYLYAATEGDAYDHRGLLERGAAVAARHALAAAEKQFRRSPSWGVEKARAAVSRARLAPFGFRGRGRGPASSPRASVGRNFRRVANGPRPRLGPGRRRAVAHPLSGLRPELGEKA